MASSQHTAPKTRAQAPSLSFDNLSPFSPSSPYLSPPASFTSLMSPPPKRESDDYLALKASGGGKKKRPPNKEQRRSPLIRSEETRSMTKSSVLSTAPRSLMARNCTSCESRKDRNVLRNATNPPSSLRTIEPHAPGRQWRRQSNAEGPTPHARASFVRAALKDLEDAEDSPALSSLRRVSRSFTQNQASNIRDLRHLSRTLTNRLNSVFAPKDRSAGTSAVNENIENTLAASKRRATAAESFVFEDDIHPLLDNKSTSNPTEGLIIPASITLRKASESFVPSNVIDTNNTQTLDMAPMGSNPPSRYQSSSKSLIAFRSKRLSGITSPIKPVCSPHLKDVPSPKSDLSTEVSSAESAGTSSRMKGKLINQFSVSAPDQRRGSIAETALTFAEFYPAPGTFVKPNSRTNSMSPDKAPFHISIMRVMSCSSAHEIIWREDETPSSRGSSDRVSPTNQYLPSPTQTNSFRHNSSESTSINSDFQATISFLTSASPEKYNSPPRNHHSESAVDLANAHKRLFAWTWGGTNQPADAEQTAPNHNRSRSTTIQTDNTAGKTSLPAVQSFPLLSDKPSTSDWHDEPTIDLDNKGPDKVPEQRPSENNTELDRGLAMFMSRSQKLAASSSGPPAARMGNPGRIGSAVGVSSHVRVKQGGGEGALG